MTFSLKSCSLLLKRFYKNNDCASVALQKFLTLKCIKKKRSSDDCTGSVKMIQEFEKTGSFDVQSVRGRKRIDSMVIEKVATAKQEESSDGVKSCSVRGIVQTLDKPVSTVHKMKHLALLSLQN